jgi:hypothetical protein
MSTSTARHSRKNTSSTVSSRIRRPASHLLVEGEVGDNLFDPAIFVLELAHAPELGDPQAGIALLPGVEGRLTDAELAADLRGRRALLGLAQGLRDLLLRGFFIAILPPVEDRISSPFALSVMLNTRIA